MLTFRAKKPGKTEDEAVVLPQVLDSLGLANEDPRFLQDV